jgi:chromosome segregation ATPase
MLEMRSKLEELDRSIVAAAAREREGSEKRDAIMVSRERMQDEMGSIRTALAADEKALDGVMESRRDAELHLVRVKEKITALETAITETRDTMLQLKPKLEASRRTAEMPDAAAQLDSADLAALEDRATAAERDRERLLEEVNSMRLEELSASNEAETAETRVRKGSS